MLRRNPGSAPCLCVSLADPERNPLHSAARRRRGRRVARQLHSRMAPPRGWYKWTAPQRESEDRELNREDLVRSLIRAVAAGTLDARLVQPVLQALSEESGAPTTAGELLEALRTLEGPAAAALAGHLSQQRLKLAVTLQGLRT